MIRLLEVLKEPNKYTNYLNSVLNNYGIDINYLEKYYKGVKIDKLYKSHFHGLYHSEKVCMYALILAKFYGLDDVETQIIRDAALYHDIGRINEQEEEFHGNIGANKIEEVIDKDKYEDKKNIVYLKSIIEAHSHNSNYKKRNFDNYSYEFDVDLDYNKYERLYNILLDADALDRTRFKKTSKAALKEEFLRTDEAKNLITFAEELNNYYSYIQSKEEFNRLSKLYNTNDSSKPYQGCFHGISSNFFALDSILKYGILSEYARKELGISSLRNFYGNNNNLFISVIDDISYSKNGKANKDFLKENISLYCLVTNLCRGMDNHVKFSDCMPTHSGEYEDEVFAFYKIAKEQIYSIVLPKNMIYKNIKDLNYMEGSNNYDLISSKVNFYLNKLKEYSKDTIYQEKVNKYIEQILPKLKLLLDEQFKTLLEFERKNQYEQRLTVKEFNNKIDNIKIKINTIIEDVVNTIFHIAMNTNFNNPITIKEVIEYILKNNNIDYNLQDSGEELLFIINHQKVKKH